MSTRLRKPCPPCQRLLSLGQRAWSDADRRLDSVRSAEALQAAQRDARARFHRLFGPLPDVDAPVEHQTGPRFVYRGLAITRLTIRSAYGYPITGWTVRREDRTGQQPGVVVAAGHAELGSLCDRYVKLALLLAMSGMHVVTFDPPGQGARREVFRPGDDPNFWDACKQHMHIGTATTLAGLSLPHFFVADGMTVVSHLCNDAGVDARRIGFTGQSGGGLQTLYTMGADPRIAAAVSSQPTSSRREAFAAGAHRDMCQTSLSQWVHAIDQHELVLLFAPRPVRLMAEYGYPDQLDVFHKLHPIYTAVGRPDDLELVSGSVEHRLSRACRELTLGWFARHLRPDEPAIVEPAWEGFEPLHRAMCKSVERENSRDDGIIAYCRSVVHNRRSGAISAAGVIDSNPYLRGALSPNACAVIDDRGEKAPPVVPGRYACALRPDYHVPFTLARGDMTSGTAVIVDEDGADSPWAAHWAALAQPRVQHVITMDVFECGRLGTSLEPVNDYHRLMWEYYGANYHAQDAFMAGHCPIGLALEEVVAVIRSAGLPPGPCVLIGRGWPALALALLAAAWESVEACCLTAAPESYQTLLRAGYHHVGYRYLVPGLLTQTDWPDLVRQDANTRYAVCEPIRIGAPTAAYDDPEQYPNVRLFESDTPTARCEAAAHLLRVQPPQLLAPCSTSREPHERPA